MVSARWNDTNGDLEVFRLLFDNVARSSFLHGSGSHGFQADFDWLMVAGNFNKVLEGKYADREVKEEPRKVETSPSEPGDMFLAALERSYGKELAEELVKGGKNG